ncbi:MAG: FAD-dependent oxidoreductase, partial [Candidatus Omnitrophica bacterium]|nr:FAD-dependent oxidoreductase [Candidatus Omnitrophota bacterium]
TFEIKEKNPSSYLLSIPTIPTFRMTRRLKGIVELKEEDEGKIFDDVVGMTGDWRRAGPVYYIPFSCLYAVKTKNLITAGRCISASSAWDIIRAIPTCTLTGEISGTAGSLLIKENSESFSNLDIKKLQETLKKQGVIIYNKK